jgi:hypothetical protein
MMCATDEQIDTEPDFISLGQFEPPDAKRILRRLEEENIPFRVDALGEVHPDPKPRRIGFHWLVIVVHPDDIDKASEIVSADNRI